MEILHLFDTYSSTDRYSLICDKSNETQYATFCLPKIENGFVCFQRWYAPTDKLKLLVVHFNVDANTLWVEHSVGI